MKKIISKTALASLCALTISSCTDETAAPALEASVQSVNQWTIDGKRDLANALNQQPINRRAKNVIFFIGDGMGITTQTAARILEGQLSGQDGEENLLSFEMLPYTALVKTYTTNHQVSDSAGTATAFHTGVKTKSGVIGLSEFVDYNVCEGQSEHELTSLLKMAEDRGMATGLVSTARITHASPAAAYAHAASREWETDKDMLPADIEMGCVDIARQLIEFEHGDGVDVILGGGRRGFLPNTVADPEYPDQQGRREDGRDLVAQWQTAGGQFVWNEQQLRDAPKGRPILGLFEPSHMQFEVDRPHDSGGEPSLTEMTATAISRLEGSEEGYYLFVEAGRIDHAHHYNNAYRALHDAVEMSRAVAQAMAMTSEQDTLIVVSADHSHSFALAGYPAKGNGVFDWVRGTDEHGHPTNEVELAEDGQPYSMLGYTTGFMVPRDEAYGELDPSDPNFQQGARIPSRGEHHGGEDVVVMARGPMAHAFHGFVEQTFLFHAMAHALGIQQ